MVGRVFTLEIDRRVMNFSALVDIRIVGTKGLLWKGLRL